MKPPKDTTIRQCRAHCGGCGSHFTSTSAFDAHRKGSFQSNDRYCEEPEDATHETREGKRVYSLELAQPDGRCEIGGGPTIYGVSIWRDASSPKPAISRFSVPTGADSGVAA